MSKKPKLVETVNTKMPGGITVQELIQRELLYLHDKKMMSRKDVRRVTDLCYMMTMLENQS